MRKCLKSISLCLALAFSIASTAAFAVKGGSIGQGDFSVMKGSQLVDKLSGQSSIADESMLVCDGKCMIKSEGISLVAADQAKFAIKNETDTFRLFLREGSIDFIITDKARKIAFHTPEGVYSVAEIIFNAASDSVVRGNVRVNEVGKTEVSVTEGKLVFATSEGMKAVNADERIVLAISEVPGAGAGGAGEGDDGGMSPFLLIGGGAALLATAIVIIDNNDDDDDAPVTSSAPPSDRTPLRPPSASPSS